MPLTDRLTGDDDDVPENLLGEVPMFRGGTASHIGGRKKLRHENPAVIKARSAPSVSSDAGT